VALLGVIAGIHGNSEALGAVLAAFGRRHVTRVLCAGDVVGYNADPAECAKLLDSRRVTAVAGRNDLVAVGRLGLHGYSSPMMHSLKRTRRNLTREAAAWLRGLPTHQVVDGSIALVHGGMREVGHPMAGPEDIRENAEYLRYDFPGARLCIYGRGRAQAAYEVDGNVVHPLPQQQAVSLRRDVLHFLHPGSVDAQGAHDSRSGRIVAEAALFDTMDWRVEFLRVPYDAASTEAKAAVFGYRMNGWTRGMYHLKRRVLRINAGR
jgi:hypothetical protein